MGPLTQGLQSFQRSRNFVQDQADAEVTRGIRTEQLTAAKRANATAEEMGKIQSEIDEAIKTNDTAKYREATFRYLNKKSPELAYKFKEEITEKDLKEAQARMVSIRMGIQANDKTAFAEFAKLNQLSPNGYEVDPEASMYDSQKNQGVLTVYNTNNPQERKEVPITGQMLDAAVLKTIRDPAQMVEFAKLNKEFATAEVERQKVSGGYGLNLSREQAAKARKAESEAAENEAEVAAGIPQKRAKLIDAQINASRASAANSYAHAANVGDEKAARAEAKRFETMFKAIGATPPGKVREAYMKEIKAARDAGEEEVAVKLKAEMESELKRQGTLYPAALFGVELMEKNKGLGPAQARDIAAEFAEETDRRQRQIDMWKAKNPGKKPPQSAKEVVMESLEKQGKVKKEGGKTYYVSGKNKWLID